MPKKEQELTYSERVQAFISALENELQQLRDANADPEYIRIFENFVNKASHSEIYEKARIRVRGHYAEPDPMNTVEAVDKYKKMASSFKAARRDLLTKIGEINNGADKALKKANVRIASLLNSNNDIVESTGKAFDLAHKIVMEKLTPDKDSLEKYCDEHSNSIGQPMTIAECCSVSIAQGDPKKIFENMLWLNGLNHRYVLSENNIYAKTLDRLAEEIEAAPVDTKMQYIALFTHHYEAYKAESSQYGFADKDFARLMLKFKPETVSMFNRFNPEFNEVRRTLRSEEMNYRSMDSQLFTLAALGSLYKELDDDKRAASESFKALKDNFKEFVDIEDRCYKNGVKELAPEDIKAYSHALNKAADAARIYINTHKGGRSTDKGKERKDLATRIDVLLNERRRVLDERIETLKTDKEVQHNFRDVNLDAVDHIYADELINLGKVQRHIAPVRIIPKNPEYKAEPSGFQKFKGALGHFAFSAVNMLIGNTVGRLISNIARPFTQRSKERPQYDLDTERIPGTDGEKFETIQLPDDPGQPIIGDMRRVPLVFERPLPEDPNQGPTVTIGFSQGAEGDPRSMVQGGTGHGHIMLKYSRINPITGKMTRYGLSVGFFPKGGFGTDNITMAQYLNGLKIPGAIGDDWNCSYATGKTFNVNNKQINQILLAAQGYEKDGYNSITRNCASFVADMASAAGIDVSSVMQKVDFSADNSKMGLGLKTLGAAKMAFLGPLYTRLAKRDILKKVGKQDLSYGDKGQNMLNAQDVKRLWSLDFNTRLKGYSPNHVAESIRKEKGTVLSSRQYEGRFRHYAASSTRPIARLYALGEAASNLVSVIRNEEQAKKDGSPQISEDVSKYIRTMQLGLASLVNDLSRGRRSFDDTNKLYRKISDTTRELKDGLNEIYTETFKGDQSYNIPFSQLMSTVEFFEHEMENQYVDFVSEREKADPARDNSLLLDELNNDKEKYAVYDNDGYCYMENLSHTAVAGIIKSFGSLKAGLIELGQNDNNIATARKLDTAGQFANAEKSFFSGRPLTQSDVKFAFVDLPKNLAEGISKYDTAKHKVEDVYQSQIFCQMFGGLKPVFKKLMDDLAADKKGENRKEIIKNFRGILDQRLAQDIARPESDAMLTKLKKALVPEICKDIRPVGQNNSVYYDRVNGEFTKQVIEAMVNSYITPLLDAALNENLGVIMTDREMRQITGEGKISDFPALSGKIQEEPINNHVDELDVKPEEPENVATM